MAENLTIKQENFARAYIETGNASEAYRRAYDAENCAAETIRVKACELLQNGNVAVMVEELKADHAERHEVTVDSLTVRLDSAYDVARDNKQASAMVSSVAVTAKIHGMITDKKQIVNNDPHGLREMSTEKLEGLHAENVEKYLAKKGLKAVPVDASVTADE